MKHIFHLIPYGSQPKELIGGSRSSESNKNEKKEYRRTKGTFEECEKGWIGKARHSF